MAKIAVYIVKKLKNICSISLSTDYKRPYAIPHVTKCKTDSGWKSRYYATILSGKKDRGLWTLSTTKCFVSLLRHRGIQESLFALDPVETLGITSLAGEKGARKLLCCTQVP